MIINLQNQSVIERLDSMRIELIDVCKDHGKTVSEMCQLIKPGKGDNEYRVSEEVLRNEYLPFWKDHVGFPTEWLQIGVKELETIWTEDKKLSALHLDAKDDFVRELGVAANALFSWYPPDGFIGWHTNWNAKSYQVIFTWSENGDGYFQYYDKLKDEVVKVPDKKGWSAKTYYFAPIEEEDFHCWHSAYTNCDRLTLCYKFTNWGGMGSERDKQALILRDLFIEHLEEK